MADLLGTDEFLVNRNDVTYTQQQETLMASLEQNDYLLINRAGQTYKITGGELIDSVIDPLEVTVVLAPTTNYTKVEITAIPVVSGGKQPDGGYVFTYQWMTADDASGTNKTTIAGETGATYTPDDGDVGKYVGCVCSTTDALGSSAEGETFTGPIEIMSEAPIIADVVVSEIYDGVKRYTDKEFPYVTTMAVDGEPAPIYELKAKVSGATFDFTAISDAITEVTVAGDESTLTLAGNTNFEYLTGEATMTDGNAVGGSYTQTPYKLTTSQITDVDEGEVPLTDPSRYTGNLQHGDTIQTAEAIREIFNGEVGNRSFAAPDNQTFRYTFPSGITWSQSIKIWGGNAGDRGSFTVNDTELLGHIAQNTSDTIANDVTSVLGTSGTLTNWSSTINNTIGPGVAAFELDGKILALSEQQITLTFADPCPDLKYFKVGDQVQGIDKVIAEPDVANRKLIVDGGNWTDGGEISTATHYDLYTDSKPVDDSTTVDITTMTSLATNIPVGNVTGSTVSGVQVVIRCKDGIDGTLVDGPNLAFLSPSNEQSIVKIYKSNTGSANSWVYVKDTTVAAIAADPYAAQVNTKYLLGVFQTFNSPAWGMGTPLGIDYDNKVEYQTYGGQGSVIEVNTDDNTLLVTNTGDRDNRWIADNSGEGSGASTDFYVAPANAVPISQDHAWCNLQIIDNKAQVTSIQKDEPDFLPVPAKDYSIKFPALFPTGNEPDADLPRGTCVAAIVAAENSEGRSVKESNCFMPIDVNPDGAAGPIVATTPTTLTMASNNNFGLFSPGDDLVMVDENSDVSEYTMQTSQITNIATGVDTKRGDWAVDFVCRDNTDNSLVDWETLGQPAGTTSLDVAKKAFDGDISTRARGQRGLDGTYAKGVFQPATPVTIESTFGINNHVYPYFRWKLTVGTKSVFVQLPTYDGNPDNPEQRYKWIDTNAFAGETISTSNPLTIECFNRDDTGNGARENTTVPALRIDGQMLIDNSFPDPDPEPGNDMLQEVTILTFADPCPDLKYFQVGDIVQSTTDDGTDVDYKMSASYNTGSGTQLLNPDNLPDTTNSNAPFDEGWLTVRYGDNPEVPTSGSDAQHIIHYYEFDQPFKPTFGYLNPDDPEEQASSSSLWRTVLAYWDGSTGDWVIDIVDNRALGNGVSLIAESRHTKWIATRLPNSYDVGDRLGTTTSGGKSPGSDEFSTAFTTYYFIMGTRSDEAVNVKVIATPDLANRKLTVGGGEWDPAGVTGEDKVTYGPVTGTGTFEVADQGSNTMTIQNSNDRWISNDNRLGLDFYARDNITTLNADNPKHVAMQQAIADAFDAFPVNVQARKDAIAASFSRLLAGEALTAEETATLQSIVDDVTD